MTDIHLAPLGGLRRVSGRRRRSRASGFLARAMAAVRDWRRREQVRNQLEALDDRTLRDIGICRSDTLYLTSKPAEDDENWRLSLRFPPF
jgi:uncharacterized protein YjiS (DUF1127 family)